MYKNLLEFIEKLKEEKEIKFIKQEVSPHLDISKITDKESKSKNGGKALCFTNVKNSRFPVTTNIFGSDKRICLALGVDKLDDLGERVKEYIHTNPTKNIKGILNILKLVGNAANFFPRKYRGKTPPCRQVVYTGDKVDLSIIPVLTCWPKDAGPFITLPMVITKSLSTGKRNIGMYRLQVFDKNTTGMHWHIHKDGSHYYNEYKKAKKRMPVAVAIGAAPSLIYAATAPMPTGMDETILAGFINKKPVYTTKCLTIDLEVPADAEFILEGYVDPEEKRLEGPFGDHTGYYSLADDYPVFHVTAITHKENPIYNATLVGRPPMEDCYMARATERLFLPLIQSVIPEITDYFFPMEGVFHNIVIVSINKEYPGHAHKVINGLWGQGQMSFCKAIIIIDDNIKPSDLKKIAMLFLTRFDDPLSDIIEGKGILDVLDHSSPYANFGAKIGFDLTKRFQGEPPRKESASKKGSIKENIKEVLYKETDFIKNIRILFSEISEDYNGKKAAAFAIDKPKDKPGADSALKILKAKEAKIFDIIILFDKDINLEDDSLLLWKVFNNVDPKRDIIIKNARVIINACKKGIADGHLREWPEDLSFDI
ncbi:MAG: menaquinone biosynthesis decarboxylase [Deltaproteobacteria bacterium]|nr:menaquinone biosynthesis decarboxylase [Deltaproteobacteria bacterium]